MAKFLAELPLTLTLSPEGRGDDGRCVSAEAAKVFAALASPRPFGERARVRGLVHG
jgi:hypothetical protein